MDKNIKKMANILNIWKQRDLTTLGKITIIKSLVIPKFTLIAGSITLPDENIIKTINTLLYNFIWNKNEKTHINRTNSDRRFKYN